MELDFVNVLLVFLYFGLSSSFSSYFFMEKLTGILKSMRTLNSINLTNYVG